MALTTHFFDDQVSRYRLRLQTLTRLRWLAVAGQSATIFVVAVLLEFAFPVLACLILVALSAALNVLLTLKHPANHRLSPRAAFAVLGFDILQLGALLFLTGGLANPFAFLICVPVIISSASQPIRYTIVLGVLALVIVSTLEFAALPLPWYPGTHFELPPIIHLGVWMSIVSMTAFAAFYAFRVSSEANLLADALATTELTLQREQHLSALDGLAAAAAHELGTPLATISVVAREMERALGDDERYREDVHLLRSQSERCRDILRRITTLSSEGEAHMRRLPLSSLIEEVVAPHRECGVRIDVTIEGSGGEPIGRRNPGLLYGLGNIVENAADFARSAVTVAARFNDRTVEVSVSDDGPGFPTDVLVQIGEPFLTRRTAQRRDGAGGLGLGLFIAKTLLERSGATLTFANRSGRTPGANARIVWARADFDVIDGEDTAAMPIDDGRAANGPLTAMPS